MDTAIAEQEIGAALIKTLKDGNQADFQQLMKKLKPYDIAGYYEELPKRYRTIFLEYIQLDELVGLLRHLTQDEQLDVLYAVGPTRSTEILKLMESNELSFLLSNLPKAKVENLTARMQKEEMESIRQVLAYPPKTAGRAMTAHYVWVHTSYTIKMAVEKLRSYSRVADYLKYIYVINDEKQLVGAISYRDLVLADPDDFVEDIMAQDIAKANVNTKQEEVARIIGRYDFASLPVTDERNVLRGVISADEVLDIVVREANEDIEMLLATGKSINFRTKPLVAAYKRLPWLILLLFIGLVSGSIIARFEETLEQVVALAFFMPMIAGMTGNTGTQSLAIVVRGLVSEKMTTKKIFKLLFREFLVGIIIGVVCAVTISVIAYVWQGNLFLGMVVGASLLATLILGTLAGTVIPLILYKFNVDPAVASGPLITTINDILSLLIYFGIATMFISKLV